MSEEWRNEILEDERLPLTDRLRICSEVENTIGELRTAFEDHMRVFETARMDPETGHGREAKEKLSRGQARLQSTLAAFRTATLNLKDAGWPHVAIEFQDFVGLATQLLEDTQALLGDTPPN